MALIPSNLTPLDTRNSCGFSSATMTIPNGTAVSNTVDFGFATPVLLLNAATWASAVITFLVSIDGVNFAELSDINGVVQTQTLAGGEVIALSGLTFLGVRILQLQSGTSASQVTQSGGTALMLICRNLN